MEEFKTGNVLEILELKRPTLQDWKDRGFVTPSIETDGTPGKPILWSRDDIYMAAIFKSMKDDYGVSRDKLFHILKFFKSQPHPWSYENAQGETIRKEPVSFKDVGPGDDQYKIFVFNVYADAALSPFDEHSGFFKEIPLKKGRGIRSSLTINLVQIKNETDDRIEKVMAKR